MYRIEIVRQDRTILMYINCTGIMDLMDKLEKIIIDFSDILENKNYYIRITFI